VVNFRHLAGISGFLACFFGFVWVLPAVFEAQFLIAYLYHSKSLQWLTLAFVVNFRHLW
jgi:hypothetical protein